MKARPSCLLLWLLPMLALPLHATAANQSAAMPESANLESGGPESGKPLPAWREGELDIHHINTGRGEAQLLILPDGTSVLVDMSGKTIEQAPFSLPTRPDASRPPGEWVARYVQRVLPSGMRKLDYALISHFHGDHMGVIVPGSPRSPNGYQLSGITQVAESVDIAKVIDRGWPHYDYPVPIRNPRRDGRKRVSFFLGAGVAEGRSSMRPPSMGQRHTARSRRQPLPWIKPLKVSISCGDACADNPPAEPAPPAPRTASISGPTSLASAAMLSPGRPSNLAAVAS